MLVGPASDLGVEASRVCEFYAANWKRPTILANEQFYSWQFKSNGRDGCVVAYDETKDAIAGVMGLTPRTFNLGGKRLKAAELTTWIVSEEYRGGPGGKILSHIVEQYDALIGMGITAMALPVYLRAGFRYLAAIPRFVRVFDFDAVARFAEVQPMASKVWRAWSSGDPVPYQIGGSDESLFERLASSYNFFTRDAEHRQWRYAKHPMFKYQTFFVRSGGGVAFVAFRKETAVPGLTIMHVMDCLGEDQALPGAFSFIDDYCQQDGAHVADFYCTSSRVNRHPLSRGWFSTLDDQYFQFPHLFHPIEVRKPATTSLIYRARDSFAEMADFSKLYVTKQDADLDRPVPRAA